MQRKEFLEKMAELSLRTGINLQPKENVHIVSCPDTMDLAYEIQKKAYKIGALDVQLELRDSTWVKNFFENASEDAINHVSVFKKNEMKTYLDEKYHTVLIHGEDPEALKDIDSNIISKRTKVLSSELKPYIERKMANEVKWTIISYPTQSWAKSLFPDLDDDKAVEKLQDLIVSINRLDNEDPIKAWKEHDANLKKRKKFLNDNDFEKLIYKGPGTDLEVYLAEGNVWAAGSNEYSDGTHFTPNMPTEEVFGMPHAYKVNGKLSSTLPLYYQGNIIDGMHFTFKDGKIVEYSAEVGEELLKGLVETDEGSRRLGEVALVDINSPIFKSGTLFKSTLYDENASCHFAIGASYADNNRNKNCDEEKKKEIGMNFSGVHVDFMVGGKELNVTGVKKDGTEIPLLVNGVWQI